MVQMCSAHLPQNNLQNEARETKAECCGELLLISLQCRRHPHMEPEEGKHNK